jgi:hypothetical protein
MNFALVSKFSDFTNLAFTSLLSFKTFVVDTADDQVNLLIVSFS